jgi:hypothetical protein
MRATNTAAAAAAAAVRLRASIRYARFNRPACVLVRVSRGGAHLCVVLTPLLLPCAGPTMLNASLSAIRTVTSRYAITQRSNSNKQYISLRHLPLYVTSSFGLVRGEWSP